MSGAVLSARDEAIVRIVHARGAVSLADLLTDYRARPMSVDTARKALARLVALGWLERFGYRRMLWSIHGSARPHVAEGTRLPTRPGAASSGACDPRSPMARASYVAGAHSTPARPGATDFLAVPSLGAFR
jgi:hypothetical protein